MKRSTAGPYINGSCGSFKSSLRVKHVIPSSAFIFILSFVRIDVSNFKFSNRKQFLTISLKLEKINKIIQKYLF